MLIHDLALSDSHLLPLWPGVGGSVPCYWLVATPYSHLLPLWPGVGGSILRYRLVATPDSHLSLLWPGVWGSMPHYRLLATPDSHLLPLWPGVGDSVPPLHTGGHAWLSLVTLVARCWRQLPSYTLVATPDSHLLPLWKGVGGSVPRYRLVALARVPVRCISAAWCHGTLQHLLPTAAATLTYAAYARNSQVPNLSSKIHD